MQRAGLRPSRPLIGALRAPGSKSLAQRALVIAALCDGTTRIRGLSTAGASGDDVQRACELVPSLGARLQRSSGEGVDVVGHSPAASGGWRAQRVLELGESGTLARLATAAAALCARPGERVEFSARGSLPARSSGALIGALDRAGVRFEFLGRAQGWPLALWPVVPPARITLESPASSQEVSALLIAAAAWSHPIEILVRGRIPSRPYVELSIAALARFGVAPLRSRDGEVESFRVHGPLRPPLLEFAIEPDASAAAVLLAAACISAGRGSVAGLGADSAQGDTRMVEHLRAFGCEAGFDAEGIFAGGSLARGAEIDASDTPDLAPVLAALAAAAALRCNAGSRLTGLETLQGKESARISVLAEGLRALGLSVRATETTLEIAPGRATSAALELDPRGDHRMAFAFALLGLARPGIDVLGPECVAKSWPGFWAELERAGARVVRGPANVT